MRGASSRIKTLRADPRPPGSEKLSAQERYRPRQGNYRILYAVADAELTVGAVVIESVVSGEDPASPPGELTHQK